MMLWPLVQLAIKHIGRGSVSIPTEELNAAKAKAEEAGDSLQDLINELDT
jgi:hypothetical protein